MESPRTVFSSPPAPASRNNPRTVPMPSLPWFNGRGFKLLSWLVRSRVGDPGVLRMRLRQAECRDSPLRIPGRRSSRGVSMAASAAARTEPFDAYVRSPAAPVHGDGIPLVYPGRLSFFPPTLWANENVSRTGTWPAARGWGSRSNCSARKAGYRRPCATFHTGRAIPACRGAGPLWSR
jgi:hypothetical protein